MIHIANPSFDDAEKDAVTEVLDSGMIADGEVVRSFEAEFADYCGTEHQYLTKHPRLAVSAA
jgi:dTDP-4-amino-4,6-dideoxygalactose transaminase